uniref:Troponin T-like isoform X5 n=1 Tax=Crassostrea virginica TaxID=6565 RepID=A0A8B8E8N2_CRAVI|nr:troponin T-like isoform X5 [Crassostrea virginica]XP_022334939.1 troponin T-like isoform X5 [Crassostrea virginica]XP_022334947.1 troponin T-like isoform X5 [Crassostrea virginica]XP_022336019.1 troponin T-like isoform X5 [Crassostrea virginica]XP_022336026.1 troponin T-like isoform X5 [Crassostrea virginica]XP_022336034.1 troponin T-like isoform X5 [Crassostrea virginica]
MSDDESHNPPEESTDAASQENEAQRAMEEAARRKAEKVAQEIAEFEEQRKEEREKEQQEIQALREKREQRKREREEEDRRLAEMRAQEEARRKSEEEEKRKKKMEEEQQRKEERERKRKEQEERIKNMSKPNFVITKHSDGEHQGEKEEESEQGEVQKSKEQLEAEKRSFLSQRIKPLPDLSGLDVEKLSEQAKELHKEIYRLMNEKYDIEEKFKRQQYDMIELAERARQMSKGKGRKGLSSAQVDESFDRLADKFAGAPPKIQLCSKYERHTDHRSYGQRLELFEELSKPIEPFSIPKKGEDGEEEGGEEEAGQEEGGEE